jgi:hypothetical protein
MDFWRRAARTYRVRIIEKMGLTQTILGRIENSMFKCYEHVARKENNRLPKRIIN